MMWKFDISKFIMPIYYFVKILGLAPFKIKNNRFYLSGVWDKIYPIIFALFYSTVSSIAIEKHSEKKDEINFKLKNDRQILEPITNHLVVLSILVIFVCMHKSIVHLMNELCIIGNELDRMGIKEDQEIIFKRLFWSFIAANVIPGIRCVVTTLANPMWDVVSLFGSFINQWVRVSCIFIFVQILICIKQRFALINEKFYLEFQTHYAKLSFDLQSSIAINNSRYYDQAKREKLNTLLRIRKIENLHFKLHDALEQTIYVFAAPILMCTIKFICRYIVICDLEYTLYSSSDEISVIKRLLHIITYNPDNLLSAVIMTFQMFIIAYASATTCEQANATMNIFLKAWNEFKPEDLQDEFAMFTLHLANKPITVSIFGLNLDYSYLYKVFCAIISYVITIEQLQSKIINNSF